ncbi:uncharacterized protein [Spinacia oleracea]|uniref:Endonuclease/exonuclease/phosphatase domain-containing protein n=1 Tax=Spinacia oleracea TaxID=3562 RepID=A0A9R0J5D9_SPIOL|nr:uncharacterized protein LOC110800231 [Spinacia oleracea]
MSIVALIETKVKESNVKKVQNKFGSVWRWETNYSHSPRRRIWLGWKHTVVTLHVTCATEQLIHACVVDKKGDFSSAFTIVYGLHLVDTRRPLWASLAQLHQRVVGPWVIMGDFNSTLLSGDRHNGSHVTQAETKDFEDCLDHTGLTELKSCGHYFAWSNKGKGDRRISSRIDRALGNVEWHTKFTDAVVDYVNPGLSDHSPLVMTCSSSSVGGGRPFKFFDYMAEHDKFLDSVKKGWEMNCHGTLMFKLWSRLKQVKQELKALHHQEFARIEERIYKVREGLKEVQSQLATDHLDVDLHEAEKNLERQNKNIIDLLYDGSGRKLEKFDDIKAGISSFYKELIGTAASSLTSIDVQMVRKGKQLSADNAEGLVRPITNDEIDAAVKGIEVNKASGLDGFNCLFFLKAWDVIKDDMYDAEKGII